MSRIDQKFAALKAQNKDDKRALEQVVRVLRATVQRIETESNGNSSS